MDREVVDQKLESLRHCLPRIEVHNYETINWHIVHAIARNHLVDFSEFSRVVALRLI